MKLRDASAPEIKPGIYYGLSFEEYRAIPAINKGGLDLLAKSPQHHYAANLAPDRTPEKETPAMRHGRAIHHAVLEPDKFAEIWRQKPTPEMYPNHLDTADQYKARCLELGLTQTGTKGILKSKILAAELSKDVPLTPFFDDLVENLSKFELLSEDEFAACLEIAERVTQAAAFSELFPEGKAEATIVWVCPRTGLLRKGRIDWLADDLSSITDLKSARDASIRGFTKALGEYNIHRQAYSYSEGVYQITGTRPKMFNFAVFEKEPPYAAGFYYASQTTLELGRLEDNELMDRYARCVRDGHWPCYPDELQPLDPPAWRVQAPDYGNQPLENF